MRCERRERTDRREYYEAGRDCTPQWQTGRRRRHERWSAARHDDDLGLLRLWRVDLRACIILWRRIVQIDVLDADAKEANLLALLLFMRRLFRVGRLGFRDVINVVGAREVVVEADVGARQLGNAVSVGRVHGVGWGSPKRGAMLHTQPVERPREHLSKQVCFCHHPRSPP